MSWLTLLLIAPLCIQLTTGIGSPMPRLMLIGTAGSRSYFYENSIRDWRNAGAYCNSLGMKLADFPSTTYLTVVEATSRANPQQLPKGQLYWTSGRESLTLTKFVWNNTQGVPHPSFIFDTPDTTNPTMCLAYSMQFNFTGKPCNQRLPFLCQT